MKIAVLNTKGGASKSTFAFQVLCTYFLQNGKEVELIELDDENKDSDIFSKSKIKTSTALVGEHKEDIEETLKELFTNNKNIVFDIGGNKTTTMAIEALKRTRLYHLLDLILIPMSGCSQDYINAKKTYELIKEFNKPILFGLSRVRMADRHKRQYQEFFKDYPNNPYIFLTDSDTIDLSRRLQKSIYELAVDVENGNLIEEYDKLIAQKMENKELQDAYDLVDVAEILSTSVEYRKDILEPCYQKLDELLYNEVKTQ